MTTNQQKLLYEKRILRYRRSIDKENAPTIKTANYYDISIDDVYDIMDKAINGETHYSNINRPIVIGVL